MKILPFRPISARRASTFARFGGQVGLDNMPASHAGDHRSEAGQGRQFYRRVVRGEQQTHLTQNQAALDVQFVSRRPFSSAPKALSGMHSPGTRILARCNSGWGLHHRSRASAQAGFISQLCPAFSSHGAR